MGEGTNKPLHGPCQAAARPFRAYEAPFAEYLDNLRHLLGIDAPESTNLVGREAMALTTTLHRRGQILHERERRGPNGQVRSFFLPPRTPARNPQCCLWPSPFLKQQINPAQPERVKVSRSRNSGLAAAGSLGSPGRWPPLMRQARSKSQVCMATTNRKPCDPRVQPSLTGTCPGGPGWRPPQRACQAWKARRASSSSGPCLPP